ncbi:serine hydrolase domain-containing protein [soil metagenome]
MKTLRAAFTVVMAMLGSMPAAAQMSTARPEAVGMSSERLLRVDAFVARMQLEGKLAGAVTAVARRGQIVLLNAHGMADIETQRAMRPDDIFQIQSMSKPVAVVAVLMLLEEGRFLLSDPVSKWLPEFRDMKVAVVRADAPEGFVLVPAQRGITIHDLLTHRAGFVGLPTGNTPAEAQHRLAMQALRARGDFTLEQYVQTLASTSLDSQPGSAFKYGPSADVLGRLVEVVSGRPLAEFLRERIFQPLAMNDTSFVVPAEKHARVVSAYARSAEKGLVKLPPYPLAPRFQSTGGNLFSTASDYLRFCQMLLNGGEFGGQRLLSRKSVELMTARHLEAFPMAFMAGQYVGLGVAVRTASGESGLIGSAGAFGWSGGYNTYFRIDPQEKLIMIFMPQQQFVPPDLELQSGFHNTVMQAIVD